MKTIIDFNNLEGNLKKFFLEEVKDIFSDLCLGCGTCSGGCPASGIMEMDPRKLVRMFNFGIDDEIKENDWIWICTMCARCINTCPMQINIPKLVFKLRGTWPRNDRPKGILGSCDNHIKSGNAMGAPREDFIFYMDSKGCCGRN